MITWPPLETRSLTDREFNEIAKLSLTRVFQSLNPAFLAEPFVEQEWQRFLFFSLEGNFVDLTRPILRMLADETRDKGFFLSVLGFEHIKRPQSYNYHWYIDIGDVDTCDQQLVSSLQRIRHGDFCIYSLQAEWGILYGIDEFSWFTASHELLPIFIESLPNLSSHPAQFLDFLTDRFGSHLERVNREGWIVRVLTHVCGPKVTENLLKERGLTYLYSQS